MKLPNLLRIFEKTEKSGSFSDFFLRASEHRREKVLREAAERANKEQRDIFTKSQLKTKVG